MPEAATTLKFLRKNAAVFVILFTLLTLAVCPLPICVDCEPQPHYGALNNIAFYLFIGWLAISSFLASFLKVRFAWIIPFGIALADVATQHLGGVPWWDVRNNEGPTILLMTIPFGLIFWSIGWAVRFGLEYWKQERHSSKA